jgi:biotin carboxylase
MPGRLAVLHHHRSFFPPDLHEAVGDAAELVWVLPDGVEDALFGRRLLRRLGQVLDIPSDDADAAAAVLERERIGGIVTFVDDNLVLAAEIAARLGLIYHTPEVARTLASKTRQRDVLAAAGVPGPRHWTIPSGLDHATLGLRARDLVYPSVLKPAAGSGSRGIIKLASADGLLAAYDPRSEYLVEEHLADDPDADPRFASYLSVESVISRGVSDHVAVCGRFPLAEPFRETGNFIPAAVDLEAERELLELTDRTIAALGIVSAVIHTEIKLTPDGPKLIEVNGRLGGRPPFVLRTISDVNLWRAACRIALGAPVARRGIVRPESIGYWRMIQPPVQARRVLQVTGLGELAELPFVESVRLSRAPGDAVDWQDGTDGKVLTVCGRVGDLAELARAVDEIGRTVRIDYEL